MQNGDTIARCMKMKIQTGHTCVQSAENSQMNKGLFTSEHGDWETPQDLIDDLKTVFTFDLDVCASRPNVCDNYYTKEDDGLIQEWNGLCWMNPPYGREISKWMHKARDTNTLALVPARTDTKWFHDCLDSIALVVFIKGRIKFVRNEKSAPAPFPSMFIKFGSMPNMDQMWKLESYGWRV
jgi:phage N-6-adenine-methyltransferase